MTVPSPVTAVRVNAYIDGFNLYHGLGELVAASGQAMSWKWLDVRALSQAFAPHDQLGRVRYFTARVTSTPHDPSQHVRQQTYIRALETLPGLSVHLGQFKVRKQRMPIVDRPTPAAQAQIAQLGVNLKAHPDGNITAKVWRTEEKGSDVNLATMLLVDAFRNDFDKAIVFSNDTDLCEPIRIVVAELGLPVVVVNPRGHIQSALELRNVASGTRSVRLSALANAQLPTSLTDPAGTFTKPAIW